jgi:hypothetical protein
MSPKWESNAYAKIHENCGGLVRWVEAYDNPHVGYHGECLRCHEDRIVEEDILPVECPDGMIATDVVDELDTEEIAAFDWPLDADYDDKQAEVQELVG